MKNRFNKRRKTDDSQHKRDEERTVFFSSLPLRQDDARDGTQSGAREDETNGRRNRSSGIPWSVKKSTGRSRPSKKRTRREQEPFETVRCSASGGPSNRPPVDVSVQKSLKNRNWSKLGLGRYVHFNIPVGYSPSNDPLVHVPVQKTHKNRNSAGN
jgi:hypothetical protein